MEGYKSDDECRAGMEPTNLTRTGAAACELRTVRWEFGILKIAEMLWYLCQYVVTIIYCNQ